MKRISVLMLTAMMAFAVTADAAVNQGDTELSFYGSYTRTGYTSDADGGTSDAIVGAVSLGHFFTEQISFSIATMGMWQDSSDGDSISLYSLGGDMKYHFNTQSTVVPYVGAHGAFSFYESNGDSENGYTYGPLVGSKFFINEKTSMFLEYRYSMYAGGVGDFVDDSHTIFAGISFLF